MCIVWSGFGYFLRARLNENSKILIRSPEGTHTHRLSVSTLSSFFSAAHHHQRICRRRGEPLANSLKRWFGALKMVEEQIYGGQATGMSTPREECC